MDRKEITDYLRRVPNLIDEEVQGLSDDELRRRPSPDGWSILEICCHLRDAAEEEGVRVRRLVEEDEPTLDPYDEQVWARERDYAGDDPDRVRAAVRAFFGGLAYQLEGLTDEQWKRGGMHPERGRVTVRGRAEAEVAHARAHLEQIKAVRSRM